MAIVGGSEEHRAKFLGEAAWRLEDALETPQACPDKYPVNILEARAANFQAVKAGFAYSKALCGLVVLSFFETPAWCAHEAGLFEINRRCGDEVKGDILLSNVIYLPVGLGVIIECICVLVMARRFWLERNVQVAYFDTLTPKQNYYSTLRSNFGLAVLVFELADCIFYVVVRPRFRLAFLARTACLCLLPSVIDLSKLVYSCLWEFFSVATFLIGTMVLFAWTAVTLFSNLEAGKKGFETFSEALNSMFVSGVSADFITVMLDSYTEYRWMGLIWLLFLVIVHVLLLSLVLDTLTAAYMSYSEKDAENSAEHKVKGILRAFRALSHASDADAQHDGEIPRKDVLEFMQVFGQSPKSVPISAEKASYMYTAVDKDDSGYVDHEEFCGICKVIQLRFKTTKKDSIVASKYPQLWDSPTYKRFRTFVEGPDHDPHDSLEAETTPAGEHSEGHSEGHSVGQPGLERLMNFVLTVNLCLVVAETSYDLNNIPEPAFFDHLELGFSLVYLGEVFVKLSVISFEEYWSFGSNKFDLFATILLLSTSVAAKFLEGNISTYANMFRLLRLFRVIKNLRKIKSVQFMINTISKLLETAKDMMTLLGVVIFFFSSLSVQIAGGQLHNGDERLEGTEYQEMQWFALNFNDFGSAFGLWFVMLLQEYNPVFPDALAKVSPIRFSWLIFPIFYLIGVSITFELVKAFTIEVFVHLYNHRHHAEHAHHDDPFHECMQGLTQALKAKGECLHYYEKGLEEEQTLFQEALEELEHEAKASGISLLELAEQEDHGKKKKKKFHG